MSMTPDKIGLIGLWSKLQLQKGMITTLNSRPLDLCIVITRMASCSCGVVTDNLSSLSSHHDKNEPKSAVCADNNPKHNLEKPVYTPVHLRQPPHLKNKKQSARTSRTKALCEYSRTKEKKSLSRCLPMFSLSSK